MELICINNKTLRFKDNEGLSNYTGEGLVEGNNYTTKAKSYIDEYGVECYYIDGLGPKLKCRFVEALKLENKSEMIVTARKELLTPCLN